MPVSRLGNELVELCAQEKPDLSAIEPILGQITPNQICDAQARNPDVDITGYSLCSISDTWGFEVYWAYWWRMSQEERDRDDAEAIAEGRNPPSKDIPPFEKLTPDKKLEDHPKWGLFDQVNQYQDELEAG